MSDSVLHVSDSEFNETVIKADGPVLVDYWAEWCGPCKMIAPVLDAIAALIPTSSPLAFTSAPPLFPGFTAASVWIKDSSGI